MYRRKHNQLEFFLAHPGGPFYAKKDLGSWDLPKGEVEPERELFAEAQREFTEETNITPPGQRELYIELGTAQMSGGKTVHAWAFESDFEGAIVSNTFEMEWPPHSGKKQSFPEMDRAEFFAYAEAKEKINPKLAVFLDRLAEALGITLPAGHEQSL